MATNWNTETPFHNLHFYGVSGMVKNVAPSIYDYGCSSIFSCS